MILHFDQQKSFLKNKKNTYIWDNNISRSFTL